MPLLISVNKRGLRYPHVPRGKIYHEPLQYRRVEAVPRYEPLLCLRALQWLRALAVALADERGAQRSRARAYSARHIQALRYVFPVDVGLHPESALWIM